MITYLMMLQAAIGGAPAASAQEVWTCEYLATELAESHEPLRADLVLNNEASPAQKGGSWTINWPGKAPINAEIFPAEFGSMGGSVALRWTEIGGKKQSAFISYSDSVLANGTKAAWLGLGKPSLWHAPGYLCSTSPSKQTVRG